MSTFYSWLCKVLVVSGAVVVHYMRLCTPVPMYRTVAWCSSVAYSGYGGTVVPWHRGTKLHIVALVVELLRIPSRSLWPHIPPKDGMKKIVMRPLFIL